MENVPFFVSKNYQSFDENIIFRFIFLERIYVPKFPSDLFPQ